MTRRAGFTLVELLVVIAIIAILAGIAVPKVAQHLRKSKVTRALADVKAIELACSNMLTDTGRSNFGEFFDENGQKGIKGYWNDLLYEVQSNQLTFPKAVEAIQQVYSVAAYRLLRKGNAFDEDHGVLPSQLPETTAQIVANLKLRQDIKKKLAASYLDVGNDPWGNPYQISLSGPPRWPVSPWPTFFRSYRGAEYAYDATAKDAAEAKVPGNPRADGLFGFPVPTDLSVYAYSKGEDGVDNQGGSKVDTADTAREKGGGDDVNNWDKEYGWDEAYGG